MVKKLSVADKEAIAQAVKEAEQRTRAEIACVVSPASDTYHSYIILYGFIGGSIAALVLWYAGVLAKFPLLLCVQLAVMILFSALPWFSLIGLGLVPQRVRHRRAAHRAFEELLILSRHVPVNTPIALLYVSLAERYVHILSSRATHGVIANGEWDGIVRTLTASVATKGVRDACIHAIGQMAQLMGTHFPVNKA